jgi:hypothetical protein
MIEARYRQSLPPHVAKLEWRNITKHWLRLTPPGAAEPIHLAPNCTMQISAADLRCAPELTAWIEGCELRGVLELVESASSVRTSP